MSHFRNDWAAKTAAGTFGGFGIAVAVAGAFALYGPGGPTALNKYQFVMWMVVPLWVAVMGGVYLFRDGRRAVLWLGGICLAAHAGLQAGRLLVG